MVLAGTDKGGRGNGFTVSPQADVPERTRHVGRAVEQGVYM